MCKDRFEYNITLNSYSTAQNNNHSNLTYELPYIDFGKFAREGLQGKIIVDSFQYERVEFHNGSRYISVELIPESHGSKVRFENNYDNKNKEFSNTILYIPARLTNNQSADIFPLPRHKQYILPPAVDEIKKITVRLVRQNKDLVGAVVNSGYILSLRIVFE